MPKYEEVAQIIRKRIKRGYYKPETLLPNQQTFAAEFDISRMTLKKALTILVKEGLISSQRGSGTKVLSPSLWGFSSNVSVKHDLDRLQIPEDQQKELKCSVLEYGYGLPDEKVQNQLLIPENHSIYIIKRLFHLNKEPYVLEELYIPSDLVPDLNKKMAKHSIHHYMTSKLKLQLVGNCRNIYAEGADTQTKALLKCGNYAPILVMEQVAYLKGGKPVEYSICRSVRDNRTITSVSVKTAG